MLQPGRHGGECFAAAFTTPRWLLLLLTILLFLRQDLVEYAHGDAEASDINDFFASNDTRLHILTAFSLTGECCCWRCCCCGVDCADGAPSAVFVFKAAPSFSGDLRAPEELKTDDDSDDTALYFSHGFSDNMVLQARKSAAVYGGGGSCASVRVTLGSGSPIVAQTDTRGVWRAELAPQPASAASRTLTAACATCATCASSPMSSVVSISVVFGEVLLCLGQSNQWLPLSYTFDRNQSYAEATDRYSDVRLFNFGFATPDDVPGYSPDGQVSSAPRWVSRPTANWTHSTRQTLPTFASTCWYTAKAMIDNRPKTSPSTPIGLLLAAVGGTRLAMWTSEPSATLAGCDSTSMLTNATGAGQMFDLVLAPFVNMSASAISWYQGENDLGARVTSKAYGCGLARFARQLRGESTPPSTRWGELPLLIFAIAPGGSEGATYVPEFREAQRQVTLEINASAFVPTHDWGDPCNKHSRRAVCTGTGNWSTDLTKFRDGRIHPRCKVKLGERAAARLATINGGTGRSPTISSCKLHQTVLTLTWSDALKFSSPFNSSTRGWSAVEVHGVHKNGKHTALSWASVNVSQSSAYEVELDVSSIDKIDAVRYAWAEEPCCAGHAAEGCAPGSCPLWYDEGGDSLWPAIPFSLNVSSSGSCLHALRTDDETLVRPTQVLVNLRRQPAGVDASTPLLVTWALPPVSVNVSAVDVKLLSVEQEPLWSRSIRLPNDLSRLVFDENTLNATTVYHFTARYRTTSGSASPWSSPARFSTAPALTWQPIAIRLPDGVADTSRLLPRLCPPGYTCFPNATAFARAVNVAGPPGPTSSKLALLCPPSSPCTLRGTQLGTTWGLEATVLMENVVLESAPAAHAGSLLNIDSGHVTGVNVSFRGGSSATGAGCVSNYHYFKCTDCVFSKCHAAQYGGALSSGGHVSGHGLVLVRPVFKGNNTCGGKLMPGDVKPCGAACWCLGTDASKCVGCTCAVHPKYGNFYCDGGGGVGVGDGDVDFSMYAPAAVVPAGSSSMARNRQPPLKGKPQPIVNPTFALFRRTVLLRPQLQLQSALLFITASETHKLLGSYALSVNGELICMGPGRSLIDSSQSSVMTAFDSFDLTSRVTGSDTLLLAVGCFGAAAKQQMALELQLKYVGGEEQIVRSDASWRAHNATAAYGPIGTAGTQYFTQLHVFYDARLAPGGSGDATSWRLASFDDSSWPFADVAGPEDAWFANAPLRSKITPPLEIHETAVILERLNSTVWTFRLQHESQGGVVLNVADGVAGSTVTVRRGEELLPNMSLPMFRMRTGNLYQEIWTLQEGANRLVGHEPTEWRFGSLELQPPNAHLCATAAAQSPAGGRGGIPGYIICPTTYGVVSKVSFSSFGTPSGSCDSSGDGSSSFSVNKSCDSNTSFELVEAACLGQHKCELKTSAFGDPCRGVASKRLAVTVQCNESIAHVPTTALPSQLSASAWTVEYAFNSSDSSFNCSDESLEAVWRLSKQTIQSTNLDMWTDSNTRQRDVACNEANGIVPLMQSAVALEFNSQRYTSEWLIQSRHAETSFAEWMPITVSYIFQDAMRTGNLSQCRRYYSMLQNYSLSDLIDADVGLVNVTSLSPPEIDWPSNMRDCYVQSEFSTIVNAYAARASEQLAAIALWLGRPEMEVEMHNQVSERCPPVRI